MSAERIIAPVTLAPDSLEAAAVAAELAAALGAELVPAGIAPVAVPDPSYGTPPEFDALQRQAEHQRLLDRITAERLEELAEALPDGVRCRTLLTWGPVGPTLVETALRGPRAGGRGRPPTNAHRGQMISDAVACGCDGSWISSSSVALS